MAKLYVVATPIGNLQDWSPRAAETLREADLIAAEDTRVTGKLCQVHGIRTPLTSCHQHNEDSKGEYLAEKMLAEDLTVALTTDAGTPCVSDPGYALVKACVERGIEVQPVPGCCAAIAFNTYTLKRDTLARAAEEAGFAAVSDPLYADFSHWVEQAVNRDVLVIRNPQA